MRPALNQGSRRLRREILTIRRLTAAPLWNTLAFIDFPEEI